MLSYADIQEMLLLLDELDYDELTLETERFTLNLKRETGGWTQKTTTVAGNNEQGTRVASIDTEKESSEAAPTEEGLIDIRSPVVGTFYRAPKPEAEPYVKTGSKVNKNSVIAIIEVMKLMNSIPAGQDGVIVEILTEDAQFVEKDQLLMRLRPIS